MIDVRRWREETRMKMMCICRIEVKWRERER